MLSILVFLACGDPAPPAEQAPAPDVAATAAAPDEADAPEAPPKHAALFKPLPDVAESPAHPNTKEKVDLGRMLYYEKRLSKNHDISCNSCHALDDYGTDRAATSTGHKGQKGGRNAPTVYNAALHIAQFWDGREPDVEAQAGGPILNPIEMAMPSKEAVVDVLKSMDGYVAAFEKAFPGASDPVTYTNLQEAIGAFERNLLVTSDFDSYLEGESDALTDEQKAGLDLFVSTGCTTCHNGVGIGGGMYMKLGLVNAYDTADIGRAEVTKNEADKYVFKVPSLRNITETGPYFHDGSVETLEESIKLMAHHQLGKDLSGEEVQGIKTFLTALTGPVSMDFVAQPELPKSGPKTPAPDPS
jgi:cytochrome c peroxidase